MYTRLRLKGEGKKICTRALDDFRKAFNVFPDIKTYTPQIKVYVLTVSTLKWK